MHTITSIESDFLQFAFPEIAETLRIRAERHLSERLEHDLAAHQSSDPPFKPRSECEEAVRRFSSDITDQLSPRATVEFQRTLRIPDDDRDYPLPPGLGSFPIFHLDDFSGQLPASWLRRGGVMMPLHQSEALWLQLHSSYPVALKVGTGKICALSGERWQEGLTAKPQNYCVLPRQPWLDGYAVEEGVIRQFVAQPLGAGYTVEEQLTGQAEWGGLQLQALPLDPEVYWQETLRSEVDSIWTQWISPPRPLRDFVQCSASMESMYGRLDSDDCDSAASMGLAAGGRMTQEIYQDERKPADYLACTGNRCFVHLCNSAQWELITGQAPPHQPPTAREYSQCGLPWFDYYDEKQTALLGGKKLKDIKSVKQLEAETGQNVLPENQAANPKVIVKYIKD